MAYILHTHAIRCRYAIVSFSSCYGGSNYHTGGPSHEAAALQSAQELRTTNPAIKNIFYWKVDDADELLECSSGSAIWKAHADAWSLKDSQGRIQTHGAAYMDARIPAFREFWVGHLVNLSKVLDPKTNIPLIDGTGCVMCCVLCAVCCVLCVLCAMCYVYACCDVLSLHVMRCAICTCDAIFTRDAMCYLYT